MDYNRNGDFYQDNSPHECPICGCTSLKWDGYDGCFECAECGDQNHIHVGSM